MINFSAQELKRNYIKWYNDKIEFNNISNNIIRIDLPFKDSSLDNLIIYAIYNNDSKLITLTDDGYTIFNLEQYGIFINMSQERLSILLEYLSEYGVKYNKETREIYLETTEKNFAQNKHRFLQCLIFLNDMRYLSNKEGKNIFLDDVAQKLDDYNISYSRDISLVDSSGMNYHFDFAIKTKQTNNHKFINAITNPNNITIIKSKVTDTLVTKNIKQNECNKFIFILNDMNELINKQNEIFLNHNGIETIKYTEIDKNITLFT